MTAEHVFKFYRAYKFFYAGKSHELEKYASIKCPALIEQRDRSFYYRISQRLNDPTIHALFTCGFFYNPRAHVSALATPDAMSAAMVFAGRSENGNTLIAHDLYELHKKFTDKCTGCGGTGRTDNHVTGEVECGDCDGGGRTLLDIDAWLYGERDGNSRALLPECIQQVISGELPLDLACLLLLIPQPARHYDWLNDMEIESPDDMGLGARPWMERLIKADQLLRLQRPTWRLDSRHFASEFWETLGLASLAPARTTPTENTLF